MGRSFLKLILTRTPLIMLEGKTPETMSWDLGYHHAKRGRKYDDRGARNKEAYKVGFDVGGEQRSPEVKKLSEPAPIQEIGRAAAIQTLRALPRGVLSGWFRNEDRNYKAKILRHIKEPEVRNAGMNLMHQVYQDIIGSQVSFDAFMNTPLKMYRAGGSPPDEPFTSYSMTRSIAEGFAAKKGRDSSNISVIEIKPKDTLGSYQTVAEAEGLIPSWEGKDFLDGDPAFRGRSNHELRDAIEVTKMAALRQDRSRMVELKDRYRALSGEIEVREASGHQSRNPYEVSGHR